MLYFRGGYTYITTKTQALEWLNSSAEQGCIFAIYELGCYHLSTGEKEKAISYFIQVANADYPGNFYDQLLPAYYAQKKLIKLYSDNIQERKYWKKKNQELETLLETF